MLLAEIFLIGIVVAVLHKIALSLYLYWTVFWLDLVMHFLGGGLIALIVLLIVYDRNFFNFSTRRKTIVFLIAVGASLTIGLCWELWEIFIGFTNIQTDQADTIIDLGMDIIGGISAFLYSKNKICQKQI